MAAAGQRPPPSYWTFLLGVASLALGVLTFVMAYNKSNAEDTRHNAEETRHLEQRLCRLEAVEGIGECKR